jgi:hypothetical protein
MQDKAGIWTEIENKWQPLDTNHTIEVTRQVKARAIGTLASTNTTHHTHAVVKEVWG